MGFNLGINLVEVDGATPSLQGAPTSVAGFVIRSARGVPGVVQQVSTFGQFTDLFGGYVSAGNVGGIQTSFVGAYALRGFFDNGGTLAFVMRLPDPALAAATQHFDAAAAGGGGGGAPPDPPLAVTAGYRGVADPGTWGETIGIGIVANNSNPAWTDAFDLTVAQSTTVNGVTKWKVVETWPKLSMSGKPGYQMPVALNDPNTGSKYIMVTPHGKTPPAPTVSTPDAPYIALAAPAADELAGTGLNAALAAAFATPSPFDTLPIQLLACPESADKVVAKAGIDYCAGRGDCMFIGHVADAGAKPLAAAKTYGQSLQQDKSYGALYLPYIQVVDPVGSVIWVPPTGHVMGVYARTDQQRGIWKAPAGNGALVMGALDVRARLNDTEHTDLVKNDSVNAIRPITGAGIIIDSSRTLSTNTLWLYVNVRLLFNFVKSSLKGGLRWVVQEPNDHALWNKIKFNSITPFLVGLYRAGAFGPGAAKDVFTVKVDSENNPPANVQQGILNVEVTFFPSRPAETIVITVGQQEGGATATEG